MRSDQKGVENGGRMKQKQRIIYYQDELHDEFAGDHIKAKYIGEDYRYIRECPMDRLLHAFWYRTVAIPLARVYMKLHFSHKIRNKEVLREAGTGGFYLYGNHTHFLADALIPTLVNVPRETAVIVHPNNVSMPVLGKITPYLGALPLPDDRGAMKHFLEALTWHTDRGDCVMIYPEAHIWPFYTGIRPFPDTSFRYPVQQKLPVFCLTNTYQCRGKKDKPQIVTYLDGPFYPDQKLSAKLQKMQLRDQVYETMVQRAQNSDMEVIRYVKKESLIV